MHSCPHFCILTVDLPTAAQAMLQTLASRLCYRIFSRGIRNLIGQHAALVISAPISPDRRPVCFFASSTNERPPTHPVPLLIFLPIGVGHGRSSEGRLTAFVCFRELIHPRPRYSLLGPVAYVSGCVSPLILSRLVVCCRFFRTLPTPDLAMASFFCAVAAGFFYFSNPQHQFFPPFRRPRSPTFLTHASFGRHLGSLFRGVFLGDLRRC